MAQSPTFELGTVVVHPLAHGLCAREPHESVDDFLLRQQQRVLRLLNEDSAAIASMPTVTVQDVLQALFTTLAGTGRDYVPDRLVSRLLHYCRDTWMTIDLVAPSDFAVPKSWRSQRLGAVLEPLDAHDFLLHIIATMQGIASANPHLVELVDPQQLENQRQLAKSKHRRQRGGSGQRQGQGRTRS